RHLFLLCRRPPTGSVSLAGFKRRRRRARQQFRRHESGRAVLRAARKIARLRHGSRHATTHRPTAWRLHHRTDEKLVWTGRRLLAASEELSHSARSAAAISWCPRTATAPRAGPPRNLSLRRSPRQRFDQRGDVERASRCRSGPPRPLALIPLLRR